jgi:cytochrome c oxidase subunit 2
VVPGLPTQFSFTPTITTEEMRGKLENPDFDYHIVCNKICGNAHFNMKMKVVVESKKDYEKWLRAQKSIEDGAIMAEDNKATELPAEIQPNNQDTTANNQLAIN